MTVRDAILAAIESRLRALPGAPAVSVEPAGDPDTFPGFELFDGGHAVIGREAGLTRYRLSIELVGYVQGSGGAAPTAERNALHAAAVAALLDDGQLGGLVELIEDEDYRPMTAVLAERRRLSFSQDLTVEFTTKRGNPALPA